MIRARNTIRESQDFLLKLQETWGGSETLQPTTRQIIGRLTVLDAQIDTDDLGNKTLYLAAPKQPKTTSEEWTERSIGLIVSKPISPHVATTLVVQQPVDVLDKIKSSLGPDMFEQWRALQGFIDSYNLGPIAIPYKIAANFQKVKTVDRIVNVYDRPVLLVDSYSTEQILNDRNMIRALGATLYNCMEHPVRPA